MKTSSRKKPATKSASKAPASKPRKVVAKVTAKRGKVSASAAVKKAPAARKSRTAPVSTRKAPVKARAKSVLTRLEETVEKGMDAIVNTGRSLQKAVMPSKSKARKTSSRKKNPPILLGAIGIDLPPIKAPKPVSRTKRK